jgi:hypothetical protein
VPAVATMTSADSHASGLSYTISTTGPSYIDRWNLIPPLPLPVVTCRYRLPPAVRVTVTGRHQVLPRHAGCHRYQP